MIQIYKSGAIGAGVARWNAAIPELVEAALRSGDGVLTEDGALCVRTGKFTGRSPADKFTVHRPESAASHERRRREAATS